MFPLSDSCEEPDRRASCRTVAEAVRDPQRLAALHQAGLLDTAAEPAFDRVTALVRRVLGVPTALVSLVDADRQVFISHVGLADPWAARGETPLSHSFCQHVVASAAPLVVEDARTHPLLHDNGAVRDIGIVAYLGVPLFGPAGDVFGSLCAISGEPRAWTACDVAVMTDLAAVVDAEVALRAEVAQRTRVEAQYRALFDASPDAVLVLDPDTETVLDANGPACALYGVAREDFIGDSIKASSLNPVPGEAAAAHLLAHGGTVRFESVQRRRDGTPFDVSISASLVRVGTRQVLLSVNRDVTERNRAQRALHESEERFRLLSETASDAILALDESGTVVYANQALATIFGHAPAALVGTALTRLMPERLRAAHEAGMARYVQTGQRRVQWDLVEAVGLRADGTEFPIAISFGEYARDGQRFFSGIIRDTSVQKAAEAGLVAAREAAEAAARLKSSLLANMSHEIRTPLTAVLGYAEILADEVAPELRGTVDVITRGAQRLLATLNAVLDLAQIESGKVCVAVEPVDLLAAAEAACAAAGPLAGAKRLGLTLGGAPAVADADRAAVGRVLAALVGNAVKFTDRGAVTVTVCAERGQAVVCVADTGAGIDPAFLPDAFDAFTQESVGHERTYEGNGLGLAIARDLVTLMGGEIAGESEKGVGSRFTVRFPLAAPVPVGSGAPVQDPMSLLRRSPSTPA